MVETLAAERADRTLNVGILPGERGATMTSVIPIASTRLQKSEP
ncbi:MAG: hypothetical protein ACLQAT_20225 [Candidatus Binataceae bacterium]